MSKVVGTHLLRVRDSRIAPALLTVFCIVIGCGGENEPPPPVPSENPELDHTTFEVEWRDDAVVLDDVAAAQSALVSADFALGELVFASEYTGLEQLTLGSAAVIGGIGLFRVLAREQVQDGELVRVEDAALTDVIQNGHIAWRRSFVSAEAAAKLGLGIDEDEADSIGTLRQPLGSYEGGELNYSGELAGFATTMKLKPGPDGTELTLTAKYDKGKGIANSAITATLHGLTNETDIIIEEGAIRSVDVRYVGVDGETTIEAGAVELGGEEKIQIPARLAMPFLIGPIPFRVELGTSLEFSSTLVGNTSAIFKGRAKFKGSAGARVDGSEVEYFSSFELADVSLERTEPFGTLTSGLGFLLNFPELTLGVGVPKVATAGVYLKFRTEILSNLTVEYEVAGIAPVITGICAESGVNFGATYGGKAAFLGIDVFEKEEPLFGKLGEKTRTGNACK